MKLLLLVVLLAVTAFGQERNRLFCGYVRARGPATLTVEGYEAAFKPRIKRGSTVVFRIPASTRIPEPLRPGREVKIEFRDNLEARKVSKVQDGTLFSGTVQEIRKDAFIMEGTWHGKARRVEVRLRKVRLPAWVRVGSLVEAEFQGYTDVGPNGQVRAFQELIEIIPCR